MLNNFLVEYEANLVEKTKREVTKEITKKVTREVTIDIARNMKELFFQDGDIAKCTGLSLEEVQNL